jgi:peptide-methionine (S)-S-oxide reductase
VISWDRRHHSVIRKANDRDAGIFWGAGGSKSQQDAGGPNVHAYPSVGEVRNLCLVNDRLKGTQAIRRTDEQKQGEMCYSRRTLEGGPSMTTSTERAVLAGGCFWGVQDLIRRYEGVISTRVGYSGGDVPNATYRNHGTHAEAIEIVFDPTKISYRRLLEFFFQIHDPTTRNRQGNDVGLSYRSAIFYTSDEQKLIAEDTIADVNASGLWPGKVVTEVAPAGEFWQAEPEHQDYLERFPNGYSCHFIRPGWKLPVREKASA